MNRIKDPLLTMLLLVSCPLMAQIKLEIEVAGLRSSQGKILLELLDSNQKSILAKEVSIQNKKCTATIDSLQISKYAVRYFHDENSNNKLDTNWLGMPSEGYGFSNNAYGNFGPKKFEEWLIDIKGNTKVVLKIKY